MKTERVILLVALAVLVLLEVFLFSANRERDAARVQLREARAEADQLHAQLDQLKSSSVATLSTENARLRAENQALTQKYARLQEEGRQTQQQVQKLNQQLDTAHKAVQQSQQQMQQMVEESQQTQAAGAGQTATGGAEQQPATESPAAALAQLNACINNLRQIDAAKQEWALENNRTASAVPTAQDLLPYLTDGLFPVCPAGGVYTINAVGVLPTCSIPGHALPQ